MRDLFRNIVRDVRTELMDQYDQNFRTKSFFGKPWKQTRFPNKRGSLMMRSGQLRRGNRAVINGNSIVFSNSQPYAEIHNEGGTIIVTAKMIKFFWAMYYKSAGAAATAKGKRNETLSAEAQQWKSLALKKPGSVMKIEKRQFIGWHPSLKIRVEEIINANMQEAEQYITNILRR